MHTKERKSKFYLVMIIKITSLTVLFIWIVLEKADPQTTQAVSKKTKVIFDIYFKKNETNFSLILI